MKLESKFQREQFTLQEECEKLKNTVEELNQSLTTKDKEMRQIREQFHLVQFLLNILIF